MTESLAYRADPHVSLPATLLLEMHRNLFRLHGDRTIHVGRRAQDQILAALGGEVAGIQHPAAGGAVISMFCSEEGLRDSDEFVLLERARHRLVHRVTPRRMIDIAPGAGKGKRVPLRGTR